MNEIPVNSPVEVKRTVGVVGDTAVGHDVNLLSDVVSEHPLVAGHVLVRLTSPEGRPGSQVRSHGVTHEIRSHGVNQSE